MGAANPILVLADVLEPIEDLDVTALHALGFVLCAMGIAGTFLAQMAMGASWRIGVDEDERTELVTAGVFRLCRNPIYTFMLIAWIGFALLVPTWLSLAAVPAGILGVRGPGPAGGGAVPDPRPRRALSGLGRPRRPLPTGPGHPAREPLLGRSDARLVPVALDLIELHPAAHCASDLYRFVEGFAGALHVARGGPGSSQGS